MKLWNLNSFFIEIFLIPSANLPKPQVRYVIAMPHFSDTNFWNFTSIIYWFWWSSHDTGTYKAGIFCCNWVTLSPIASSGFFSAIQALSTQCQASAALYSSSSLQTSTTWVTPTLQTLVCQHEAQLCPPLELQLLHSDSQETTPWRFHLNAADLVLITVNFLAPADHCQLSQQRKGFSYLFWHTVITNYSLASAAQNHRFLTQIVYWPN